jgi:hypothetical protein
LSVRELQHAEDAHGAELALEATCEVQAGEVRDKVRRLESW